MDIEDIIELLTMETVSEGLGSVAAVGLLVWLFLGGGVTSIIEALISNIG